MVVTPRSSGHQTNPTPESPTPLNPASGDLSHGSEIGALVAGPGLSQAPSRNRESPCCSLALASNTSSPAASVCSIVCSTISAVSSSCPPRAARELERPGRSGAAVAQRFLDVETKLELLEVPNPVALTVQQILELVGLIIETIGTQDTTYATDSEMQIRARPFGGVDVCLHSRNCRRDLGRIVRRREQARLLESALEVGVEQRRRPVLRCSSCAASNEMAEPCTRQLQ